MSEIAIEVVQLVFSIILCQIAGLVGSIFTVPSIPTWYRKLKKPSYAPPNRVFGPVWITLYTLMGISLFLMVREGLGSQEVQTGLGIFGIQLILNVIWSFVFFGRKSILGGLVTISVLWIAILLTIISFIGVSTLAGLLLVPYLLWSSFAAILNYSILKLNRG
jgi:benzodiazapine receptor